MRVRIATLQSDCKRRVNPQFQTIKFHYISTFHRSALTWRRQCASVEYRDAAMVFTFNRKRSVARRVSHPRQHTAHVGKTLGHARHRIVAMDLVLQVHEPLIANSSQRSENSSERNNSLA